MSVLVAVLLGLVAAGHETLPGFAQEATPAAAGVVLPPDAEVDGLDLGVWSARSWQWFFSLPEEVNPFFDATGELCGYGQSGPVFFLAGSFVSVERSCVIPEGVHIFVPLIGSECSTVESPPFFGRDEDELRRCANEAVDHAESAVEMSRRQSRSTARRSPIWRCIAPRPRCSGCGFPRRTCWGRSSRSPNRWPMGTRSC